MLLILALNAWNEKQQNEGLNSGHNLKEKSKLCHERRLLRPATYGAQCVESELIPQCMFADVTEKEIQWLVWIA